MEISAKYRTNSPEVDLVFKRFCICSIQKLSFSYCKAPVMPNGLCQWIPAPSGCNPTSRYFQNVVLEKSEAGDNAGQSEEQGIAQGMVDDSMLPDRCLHLPSLKPSLVPIGTPQPTASLNEGHAEEEKRERGSSVLLEEAEHCSCPTFRLCFKAVLQHAQGT